MTTPPPCAHDCTFVALLIEQLARRDGNRIDYTRNRIGLRAYDADTAGGETE